MWSGHTHHYVYTGNHREGNFFIFWTRTEYQHVCTECRDVDWFANILSE